MMKTFKDLVFKPHSIGNGIQAVMFFDNGYGVSVVRFKMSHGLGYGSYTNNDKEYELAVLYGNESEFELSYNTPITDDVIGYLSASKVTNIMKRVQNLKS